MGTNINTTQPDDSSEVANAIENINTKLDELAAIKDELAALKTQMTAMTTNSAKFAGLDNLTTIKNDLAAIKSSLATLANKNFSGGGGNTIKAIYHLGYDRFNGYNSVSVPSGVNLSKCKIKCIGTLYTTAGREGVAAATGEIPYYIENQRIYTYVSNSCFSVEITEYN